jgi:hypothetical protein
MGRRSLKLVAGVATAASTLVFALPALANAPNPIAGSTKVDSYVINQDGSRTITVEGQWVWVYSSEKNCAGDRNGVGYQVAWFDPSDPGNPIGPSSAGGVIGVGVAHDSAAANDNIVHSDLPLGETDLTWDGVPSTYLAHNATDPTPSQTDAQSWVSSCGTQQAAGWVGSWGPISHTYPASDTGPITICPVTYDPHGTAQDKGGYGSGVGDITAGGSGHNKDNSYEGNGTGANGNNCAKFTIPTISTSATSNTTGNPIHDTATVSGTNGAGGTITWNLYTMPTDCSGTPAATVSVPVSDGDGAYVSPDVTPTAAGRYQWVATYSSSVGTISTSCSDTNEQSTVTNSPTPGIGLVKLERDGSSGQYLPGPITVKVGDTIDYLMTVSNTGSTKLVLNFQDPVCGGTLSGPTVVSGTYDASSQTLSVGGVVQYTCTHLMTSSDPSPFENTATVTGTPPSGSPVSAQSSVLANKQAVQGRKIHRPRVKKCPAGTVKKTKRNKHGKTVVSCVAHRLAKVPRHFTGFTG